MYFNTKIYLKNTCNHTKNKLLWVSFLSGGGELAKAKRTGSSRL